MDALTKSSIEDIPLVDSIDFFGEDEPVSVKKVVKREKQIKKASTEKKNTEGNDASVIPEAAQEEENTTPTDDPRGTHDIHAIVMVANDSSSKKLLKTRKARRRNRKGTLENAPSVPPCILRFSELTAKGVPSKMVHNLAYREMSECTAVQMQAIPAMLSSVMRDEDAPLTSLVCAPTGSGKTIAYLVPLATFVLRTKKDKTEETDSSKAQEPKDNLRAIVIVPTRELAMQIERELHFLTDHLGVRCMRTDKSKSQTSKQDVLVSTPKRVLTLLAAGHIAAKHFRFCVLDEFDRLFDRDSADMHKQTLEILEAIPKDNAILGLFSATIPQRLEESFRRVYPLSYYRILIGSRVSPTSSVTQRLQYVRDEASKIDALRRLITAGFRAPMLIFVHTTERCAQFARAIETPSLRVAVLRSDMPEKAKNLLIEQFRLGEIFVLITTDMLARGMDFKDVGTVLNADIPLAAETYVHRVGRCGRAGGQGTALTFFTDDDKPFVPAIARMITAGGGHVEPYLQELKAPGAGKLKRARVAIGRRFDLPR